MIAFFIPGEINIKFIWLQIGKLLSLEVNTEFHKVSLFLNDISYSFNDFKASPIFIVSWRVSSSRRKQYSEREYCFLFGYTARILSVLYFNPIERDVVIAQLEVSPVLT